MSPAERPGAGAETLAALVAPYFDRHWDGFHGNLYTPPDQAADRAALVRAGRVFHFAWPVFKTYREHAVIAYRTLVRNCLALGGYHKPVQVEGLPSFGRVLLTRKPGMTMVHLLCYCPESRGSMQIVEEPLGARDLEITVRLDAARRAYQAPDRQPLELVAADGIAQVHVPELRGYAMVVIEEDA